ncbi:F-box/LRR-repeat protein 15 [Bienertia sinuspersici]
MDYADNHLSRVVQQQIPVLKLAVNVAVIGLNFVVLIIDGAFPYSITEAKWLRSLTLQGCKFISNNNSGMYSSLQQLHLSQVLLFSDEALSNIANCCPEIEVIEFDCSKEATVKGDHSNLQSVDITETNLKFLTYNSFPLLENAKLSSVIPYTEVLDRITVANPHLRSLKLLFDRVIQEISINCPKLSHFDYTGAGFEEVYLDCPRLRTCYYDSREVPRLILLDSPTDMQYNFYRFDVDYKLDSHGVQAFKPKNVHLQVQILYGGPETNQFSTAFVDGLQLCSKYWWHNISDFEVKHKEKDMTQNLASLVEMTKQSRRGYLVGLAC